MVTLPIPFELFLGGVYFLIGAFVTLGISAFVRIFFHSLTVRAYRIVFQHYAYVSSAFFGGIMSVSLYNRSHLWQEYIFILGVLLLFIGSFYIAILRRKSIIVPLLWGLLVLGWSYVGPISVS